MSFSMNVKKEVSNIFAKPRHCNIAELIAILNYSSQIDYVDKKIIFNIESKKLADYTKKLLDLLFNFKCKFSIKKNQSNSRIIGYELILDKLEIFESILLTTEMIEKKQINTLLLKKSCCKRAYIKISFLIMGSLSNPKKSYHMEFVNSSLELSEGLLYIINSFNLNSKIIKRKKNYIIYLKESENIIDLLNIIGAHNSLMDLENIRIFKDVSNNTNRFVNCETANIKKTAKASVNQCNNINYIKKTKGLIFLSPEIRKIAEIRLKNPEFTLKEIGEQFNPVISKSGVNYKFKKINEIANDIKGGLL